MSKLKLDWQVGTASGGKNGYQSFRVYFKGGFQLYVHNKANGSWKGCKRWRVWWGDQAPKIPGLNDGKSFATMREAQEHAEKYFVPMLHIAPMLFVVTTVRDFGRHKSLVS